MKTAKTYGFLPALYFSPLPLFSRSRFLARVPILPYPGHNPPPNALATQGSTGLALRARFVQKKTSHFKKDLRFIFLYRPRAREIELNCQPFYMYLLRKSTGFPCPSMPQ